VQWSTLNSLSGAKSPSVKFSPLQEMMFRHNNQKYRPTPVKNHYLATVEESSVASAGDSGNRDA
jgi:hypothetical protein